MKFKNYSAFGDIIIITDIEEMKEKSFVFIIRRGMAIN